MFSYQHIYHAGSLADVHKHALLSVLLAHLTSKEEAVSYFETHAGRGVYDLSAPEAKKTGEAKLGIVRLLKDRVLAKDHPYMGALGAFVRKNGPKFYPGSPALAYHLLRDTDVLHLMELHPQEHAHLIHHFDKTTVHVHRRDGYEGVWVMSPPLNRRGLVLIDPSYEDKGEYARTIAFAQDLLTRWQEATIAIWYPVLRAGHEGALKSALVQSGLCACTWEVLFPEHVTGYGLKGTGFVVINGPSGAQKALMGTHEALKHWLES